MMIKAVVVMQLHWYTNCMWMQQGCNWHLCKIVFSVDFETAGKNKTQDLVQVWSWNLSLGKKVRDTWKQRNFNTKGHLLQNEENTDTILFVFFFFLRAKHDQGTQLHFHGTIRYFKGVLHLLPKISMFCALSQNYQQLFEKWIIHLIKNCSRNSKMALKF